MKEPIWNVRVTVLELVPAATAGEAIEKLRHALQRGGFTVYEGGDATKGEPLSADVDDRVREDWSPENL